MIILDTTTKSLEVSLSAAVAATQLSWSASYVEITTTSFAPAATDGATNGATAVTMVSAPAASAQRQVKLLSVVNEDTTAATVSLKLNNNGTRRLLYKATLAPGESLVYADGSGFRVTTILGATKTDLGLGTTANQTFASVTCLAPTANDSASVRIDAGSLNPSAFVLLRVGGVERWRTGIGIGTVTGWGIYNSATATHALSFDATTNAATFAGKINGLTLTAATTGFSVSGGTTSKTLTVSGDAALNQNLLTTSSPTFRGLSFEPIITALPTTAVSYLGSTGGGGSAPFAEYGNLIIASRLDGMGRDILFYTGVTPTARMIIDRNGYIGAGSLSPAVSFELYNPKDSILRLVRSTANAESVNFVASRGGTSIANNQYSIDLIASSSTYSRPFKIRRSADSGASYNDYLTVDTNGKVGIWNNSPRDVLDIAGNIIADWSDRFFGVQYLDGSSYKLGMSFVANDRGVSIDSHSSDGNGYIRFTTGSGSERMRINYNGTIRFNNYPAGTLVTDASGNITSSSDETLKDIDGAFTRGLADLLPIAPITYYWNAKSGLDRTMRYSGFGARNVRASIPEAVFENKDGLLSLQDRPILAAVVNALKEVNARLLALEAA